ncbi:CHAT domain-containing tetratricopeptide repeat protein [Micromonospora sp. NPDC049101]|uniref:CHAT domain-containing protein n=1 Tax=Micromonospora sp. NPDC049101 TaxID=3155032 RepID=UPI0033C69620
MHLPGRDLEQERFTIAVADLLAAVRAAPQEPNAELLAAVDAIAPLLVQLERWPELAEVSLAGVAFAGQQRGRSALRMLHNYGIAVQQMGDNERAAQVFTTVEQHAAAVGEDLIRAKALAHLGLALCGLHEPEQAVDRLQRAASIYRALGDRQGEARTYGNLEGVVAELGDTDLALDYSQRALDLFRALGDHAGEARCIQALADYHAEWGELDNARSLLREAIDEYARADEPARAAAAAFQLARMCRAAGLEAEAVEFAAAALQWLTPLGHELAAAARDFLTGPEDSAAAPNRPDRPELAKAPGLDLLAAAYGELAAGDYETAAGKATDAAIQLERAGAGYLAGEALITSAIARRHVSSGDLRRNIDLAIAALRRALGLLPRTAYPLEWARALGTLAVVYWQHPDDRRRNVGRAVARQRAALTVLTCARDPEGWATARCNLGLMMSDHIMSDDPANLEEARRHLTTALRTLTDLRARAHASLNLSLVYRGRLRGDPDANLAQSLRFATTARDLYSDVGDRRDVVAALDAMATTLALSGARTGQVDIARSVAIFREALRLASVEDDPIQYAHISDNFARSLLNQVDATEDDLREAVGHNGAALEIYDRDQLRHDGSAARNNRAELLERLGATSPDEIVRLHEEALAARPIDEVPGHWSESAIGLSRALLKRAQRDDLPRAHALLAGAARAASKTGASDLVMSALSLLGGLDSDNGDWPAAAEAWRGAVAAAETAYASATLTTGRNAELRRIGNLHREAAYAMFRAGDVQGAALLLETARAREVSRLLNRDRADLARLEQVVPHLAVAYRVAAARLTTLDAQQRAGDHGAPDRSRLYGAVTDADAQLRAVLVDIRATPGFAEFGFTDASAALRVAGGAAPVVYLVTAQHGSVALLVGESGNIDAVPGELTEPQLLRAMLNASSPSTEPLLDLVGDGVAAPVAARLAERGDTEAVLVPCGLLAALPLHAARFRQGGGQRCLIDDIDVSYTPSARALQAVRGAASVATDARLLCVAEPLPTDAPLPGTIAEVAAISLTFPGPPVMAGQDATKEALVAALPGVTHLHLACHGVYEPENPLDSRLLLAQGTALTLRELFDAPVLAGVRLVVASACETAITDIVHTPEEALGMPAGLLLAGATTAVGSLWPVQDVSAPVLMARFYTYLHTGDPDSTEGPMRPGRAMSRAQRWMRDATDTELNSFAAAAGLPPVARRDGTMQRFSRHPEHWAPFVVVGDG